ncbi:ejaculatory bulb-specific protein 3-like [Pectinophora gossypiella]|uniref:ejaculatory bulb-specific protein 3-like n=1 Tax=Pectinophora gossypiella TaxID=13191 RepID=UPI00214EBAC9|nr:ejaculatory bulb-specific protein 3-like [Pectinophora gossypiella]
MNWLTLLVGLVVVALAVCEERYTDRYDEINIDEILSNRRLLLPYIKCLLDQGRCTPEGKALKTHVVDGLQSACSKCTEVQKKMARKTVKHIREHENDSWEKLKAKYDPGDKYQEVYEAFLAANDE